MVDRQGFSPTQEFAIPGDNARGKVPGKIKHTRPSRTQKRVGHFGGNGLEPFIQDCHGDGIQGDGFIATGVFGMFIRCGHFFGFLPFND